MRAKDAVELTESNQKPNKILRKALKAILAAANEGEYVTRVSIGNADSVKSALRELGYVVTQDQQEVENHIIAISWGSV